MADPGHWPLKEVAIITALVVLILICATPFVAYALARFLDRIEDKDDNE